MYIEASAPRSQGELARLISQVQQASRGACLKFWYHMYGNHIGTISVYSMSGNVLGNTLWSKSSDQGNQWNQAFVDVTASATWQVWYEEF
jgi:hypothetical protein